MNVTAATVVAEQERLIADVAMFTAGINRTREQLSTVFDTNVESVTERAVSEELSSVFGNPDQAINIAGLSMLLRTLDVEDDYPGFIVDEILGRELAGTIAGEQPQRTLAEATFHLVDAHHHTPDAPAGVDDLEAAVIAGLQVRLPGWSWQRESGPFADRKDSELS